MDNTFFLTSSVDIPYGLWFSDIPPASVIGNKQAYPFTISLCAADTNPHVIDLYAQYSNSLPYQTQNKWSHLVPSWRFIDTNDNVITTITTTDTPIMSGTEVIGVSGFAEFYYIDDISSQFGKPVIIWATLSVSSLPLYSESKDGEIALPSYANSKIIAALPFYINGLTPTELRITRNGIDEMSEGSYWINQNIPNITTINGDNYSEFGCTVDKPTLIYDCPSSNQLGLDMGIINLGISTIPASSQSWVTLDSLEGPYFQRYESELVPRGGYSRNMVKTGEITLGTTITANANVAYEPFKTTAYAWISNPNNNKLQRIYYPYVSQEIIDSITSWLESFSVIGTNNSINTEYLTSRPEVMSLSGFGGIYGIAVDPCYNVWATDAELDKIYKFNSRGNIVSSIDLSDTSTIGLTGGCTPAGISLDSTNKVWVTLFDSTSVLKFDGTTGELLTTINAGGNQTPYVDGFGIDPDFKPTLAETDMYDNVWVSYTNSLCSYVYKYDSNGTQLTSATITLPLCSNPMDLCFDKDQNLWATLTYHSYPNNVNGKVIKINTTTNTIISSITALHPEYLTVDIDNNVWFSCDYAGVTKINNLSGTTTLYTVTSSTDTSAYDVRNENCIEGIAADAINRIWVINAIESRVYILSSDGTSLGSHAVQDSRIDYIINDDLSQSQITYPIQKSLQAFGDWTGLRWFNKNRQTTTFNGVLTGQSAVFDIDSYDGYDFRKFNESWDATTQIHEYALNESMYNNLKLFENYIGTMVGGLETSAYSIARKAYEKIANFVANNADIDVCGVNQLYSLAQQTDVPVDDYNFHFPAELKRLMDIVSIDHKKLWGDRCKCGENYRGSYGYCDNCGHNHGSNRGDTLDTDMYTVTADVPFLTEYRFNRNHYEKIVPRVTGMSLYNSASTFLLNDPQLYCYYEYIPTRCNIQIEGVINWEDDYTTLDESASGLEEWYGKGQLVEKILNYTLHKGLDF